MTDTTDPRIEPVLAPSPANGGKSAHELPAHELPAHELPAKEPHVPVPPPSAAPVHAVKVTSPAGALERIEDKTARIEEKFSRAEELIRRLETRIEWSADRTNALARQADIATLEKRINSLPGFGALLVAGLVGAVAAAAMTVAAFKFLF